MKKIYVSAIYTSPPNSMGGNTKITIELINNLCDYYDFVIFTTEPETFKKNLNCLDKIKIVEITYNFKKFNYFSHLKEIKYISGIYKQYFTVNKMTADDYFYSASDFAPDVLPIFELKKIYKFNWIASLYLFIPNPIENLINNYGFPFLKYVIYYFYQKYLFAKILNKFDLCLITNNDDKKYFPKNQVKDVLAIYGGVNVEQIDLAVNEVSANPEKKYDVIFCSRLHPQKGISQVIDIWLEVIHEKPNLKLGIIGNGEKNFETYLKQKVSDFGLNDNIEWLGYVNNVDKYKLYLKSRIMIHMPVYDNNGMVAAEALCSGLPVVMNDLSKLKFYTDGCVKVDAKNKKECATTIIKLISDIDYYNSVKLNGEAIIAMRNFWQWSNRALIFKDFLQKYEKNVN
ncbi:MAG: glycosyltransferase [Candidatus Falkowbacteria bacterium]